MTADVTGILRQTALFCSVPPGDLAVLAAASHLRSFRRGQVVFITGDPGNTLVVVVSGRVKVVARAADGSELTLTRIGPGGMIGELSVADGGPRSADAETLDDCPLLFLPRDMVWEICSRMPPVAQALAGSLAATLWRLTDAASDLVFLDLPRRVAKVLLSQPSGDDGVIQLTVSQAELAHQAGGTRQSVNAALRGFERRGWIHVQNRVVTVKQPAALGQFAGS